MLYRKNGCSFPFYFPRVGVVCALHWIVTDTHTDIAASLTPRLAGAWCLSTGKHLSLSVSYCPCLAPVIVGGAGAGVPVPPC